MSGLDSGAIERDASPPQPQPSTPPAPAAVPSSADAPTPADEDEYSNYSDDDSEDDSESDETRPAKRTSGKKWTDEDDAVLVAALRAGQSPWSIRIPEEERELPQTVFTQREGTDREPQR